MNYIYINLVYILLHDNNNYKEENISHFIIVLNSVLYLIVFHKIKHFDIIRK